MSDKWIKRWPVPKSSGDGDWIVAVDKDNNYACNCPHWIFRRIECKHIKEIKLNPVEKIRKEKPEYVLAMVLKPTLKDNKLLIPLVPFNDESMMEATICYYLLKHGYSMREVRELREIPKSWTSEAIFDHIKTNGEVCYPEKKLNNRIGVIKDEKI